MSVPVIGSNSSANGTIVVPIAPDAGASVAPYTGGANRLACGGVGKFVVMAGVVVVGLMLSV